MNIFDLVQDALQMLKDGLLTITDYITFLGEIAKSKTEQDQADIARKFGVRR